MGNSSSSTSKENANKYSMRTGSDSRGYQGLMEDIAYANRLSPLYRDAEGWQLLVSIEKHLDGKGQAKYQKHSRILIRVPRFGDDETVAQKIGSRDTGNFVPLPYLAFQKVLRKMEADAEAALAAQMRHRGSSEPKTLSGAARVLREDGTVESVGECGWDACGSPQGGTSSNVCSPPASDSSKEGLGPSVEEVRKRLRRFYQANNRDKLAGDHIGDILSKYTNNGETLTEWGALNRCLTAAYGEDLTSQGAVAVGSARSSPLSSRGSPGSLVARSPGIVASPNSSIGSHSTNTDSPATVKSHASDSPATVKSHASPGMDTPPPRAVSAGGMGKRRAELECLMCCEMTGSGITLPCMHGPFCDSCVSVWSSMPDRPCPWCRYASSQAGDRGADGSQLPSCSQMHQSLVLFIKGLS